MKVRVESLRLKQTEENERVNGYDFETVQKLKGEIDLHIYDKQLTNRIFVHGNQTIDVEDLPEYLIGELLQVITKIEKELNKNN